MILTKLALAQIKLHENKTMATTLTKPTVITLEPREYQQQAIDYARETYTNGAKIVSLVAPCGAGKTVIFAQIAWLARARGNTSMVIVPYQSLLDQFVTTLIYKGFIGTKQMYEMVLAQDPERKNPFTSQVEQVYNRLLKQSKPAGRLWQSEIGFQAGSKPVCKDFSKVKVIVAMGQTIESRGVPDVPISVICIDESHQGYFRRELHQQLDKYKYFKKSKELLLTATPWRGDGAEYPEGVTHHQVTTTHEMIQTGFNSPYRYFPMATMERKQAIRGDFTEAEELAVLEKVASPESSWEMLANPSDHLHNGGDLESVFNQQTIFFFGRQAIARKYMAYFGEKLKELGIDKELILVCDSTKSSDRVAAFQKFREKKALLFTVTCLAIGFDEPSVENIVLLRTFGQSGFALFTQILGRGLRMSKSTGKTECRMFDMCANPYFPLPDEVFDWTIPEDEKLSQVPIPKKGKTCKYCGTVCGRGMKQCYKCGEELPKPEDKTEEEEFNELQALVDAYSKDSVGEFYIDDRVLKQLNLTLLAITQEANALPLDDREMQKGLYKSLELLRKAVNGFIFRNDERLPNERLQTQTFELVQYSDALFSDKPELYEKVQKFQELSIAFLKEGDNRKKVADKFLEDLKKQLGTSNVVKFVERLSTAGQSPEAVYRIYLKLAILMYGYSPGWSYFQFKKLYPDVEPSHAWKKHAIFGESPTYGNYLFYHAYLRSKYGHDGNASNKKVYGALSAEFGMFTIEFNERYQAETKKPEPLAA